MLIILNCDDIFDIIFGDWRLYFCGLHKLVFLFFPHCLFEVCLDGNIQHGDKWRSLNLTLAGMALDDDVYNSHTVMLDGRSFPDNMPDIMLV